MTMSPRSPCMSRNASDINRVSRNVHGRLGATQDAPIKLRAVMPSCYVFGDVSEGDDRGGELWKFGMSVGSDLHGPNRVLVEP